MDHGYIIPSWINHIGQIESTWIRLSQIDPNSGQSKLSSKYEFKNIKK